jgi:hypothetical protein
LFLVAKKGVFFMSLVSQGFLLTVTLSDTGGNKSILKYKLQAADFATATTDAGTILTALAAVTDALLLAYHLSEVFEEDSALYGSGEVENVASMSARIDAAEVKYATVRIPAPSDGIFQAASGPLYNVVDPGDTDLVAYLNVFVDTAEAYLSDGENLLSPGTAGNVTGKRIHRKSRKG